MTVPSHHMLGCAALLTLPATLAPISSAYCKRPCQQCCISCAKCTHRCLEAVLLVAAASVTGPGPGPCFAVPNPRACKRSTSHDRQISAHCSPVADFGVRRSVPAATCHNIDCQRPSLRLPCLPLPGLLDHHYHLTAFRLRRCLPEQKMTLDCVCWFQRRRHS